MYEYDTLYNNGNKRLPFLFPNEFTSLHIGYTIYIGT